MLKIIERIKESSDVSLITLTLPFEKRQKSRQRVTLDNGNEAELILERGVVLRHGDFLGTIDGQVIEVLAAHETVSTVRDQNTHSLSRACYHLGNRHVPLQIGDGWLRYLRDHVLDEMIRSLGLSIEHEEAPFEPEAGAYHKNGSHHHTHSDEH